MVSKLPTIKIDYDAYHADREALRAGLIMRNNGLPVDSAKVWEVYKEHEANAKRILSSIKSACPKLNPNSHESIRDHVYGEFGALPPLELSESQVYTTSGEKSVGKIVLAALVRNYKLEAMHSGSEPSDVYWILRDLVRYSEVKKTLESIRSYMKPSQIAKLNKYKKKGSEFKCKRLIYPDGRVRSSFRPVTLNGRYSSSGPNVQQLNSILKQFFRLEGYSWVQADYDQIHVRIQANQWGIKRLRKVLVTGEDPHLSTMGALLGRSVIEQSKGFVSWTEKPIEKTPCDDLRQLGKIVNYGAAYGAQADVLFGQLLKNIEDGEPVLAHVLIEQLYDLLERREKNEPDWRAHYNRVKKRWKSKGYLESEGTGRRFEVRSGKVTELYNCTVLGFEADLVGHITRLAADRWPDELVNQTHDALCLLTPEHLAEERAQQLTELMSVYYHNHPIPYTASAKISNNMTGKDAVDWEM